MMKKSILFLTDISNGEKEDLITANYLRKDYNVTISYLEDIAGTENNYDLIIVRNTWPSDISKWQRYIKLKRDFFQRAKNKNLNVYNDLNASADRLGKDYLVELYKNNYPVIPTADNIKDVKRLPRFKQYLSKPKDGFSSFGIRRVLLTELGNEQIQGNIIQPKIDFEYEISFYFVDDKYLYSLIFAPSKIPVWPKPKLFEPSEQDLLFARKFVAWNKMKYGIQRIDAIRLYNGDLLLLEIEDDSPFFSLTEINEQLRNLFLDTLIQSLKRFLHHESWHFVTTPNSE